MEQNQSVSVSAAIENNSVTIFGYTSPNVRVEMTSPKVYAVTYSDNTGYFLFNRTYIPKNPSDLCLSSIDDNHRPSSPLCVPAPPATNYHTDIGPVILPPTLTIDTEKVIENSTTVASGQSIPNSPINIYLYQTNDQATPFVKQAQAFSLPVFETNSDQNGNYSFSLPTAYSSNYRLYSTVKYDDQQSPKSNSLLYLLPSQFNFYLIIVYIISVFIFAYLLLISRKNKKHYYPALFSYPLSLRH